MPRDMSDPCANQAKIADFPGSEQHFRMLLQSGFATGRLSAVDVLEVIGQHRLFSLDEIVGYLFDGYRLDLHRPAFERAHPDFRTAIRETLSHARNLGHIGPDEAQYLSSVFGVELKNVQFPDA